ncbi:DUF6362 family protein [Tistrella mobilis]
MARSPEALGSLDEMEGGMFSAPRAQDLLAPVKALFDEAAQTLRRLPPAERPQRARISWDDLGVGSGRPMGGRREAEGRGLAPDAGQISRLDLALEISLRLEPVHRRIIWARAEGRLWKVIAGDLGLDRTTCWRHWQRALGQAALIHALLVTEHRSRARM